jgi:hypothetical protein
MTCRQAPDGSYRFNLAVCATPLVVAWDDASVEITRPPGTFPIGPFARTEWVSARTPWLAIDADRSGCVERDDELFGPRDGDGFAALAALDADRDGQIDARDPAFSSLVLWADRDQDRRCTPAEVSSVADAGVVAIELRARSLPAAAVGSYAGAEATFWFRAGGAIRTGRVLDLYLGPLPR